MTFKNNHSLYYSIISGIVLNSVVVIISYLSMMKVWRKISFKITQENLTTMSTEISNINSYIRGLDSINNPTEFNQKVQEINNELDYHYSFLNSNYFNFKNTSDMLRETQITHARAL